MKHIKKFFSGIFREKATTILLIIGFCLTFFIVINGIEAFNEMLTVEEATSESGYKYELHMVVNVPEDCDLEALKEGLEKLKEIDEGNCILWKPNSDFILGSQKSLSYVMHVNEDMENVLEGNKPLNKQDVEGTDWIIVGAALEKLLKGNDELVIAGRRYEVIGVLKDIYKDITGNEDNWISIYSLDENRYNDMLRSLEESGYFRLDIGSDKEDISYQYNVIQNIFKPLGFYVGTYDREELVENIKTSIFGSAEKKIRKIYIAMLLVFAVVNCFFVSDIWVSCRMNEYAIKKTFGMSKNKILMELMMRMTPLAIIAFVLALFIQAVYTAACTGTYDIHYVEDMGIILLSMLVVMRLSTVMPLRKICALKPADCIRTL